MDKSGDIASQTVRLKDKVSDGENGGLVRFIELGSGKHRLQLTTPDKSFMLHSQEVDLNLPERSLEVRPQAAEKP